MSFIYTKIYFFGLDIIDISYFIFIGHIYYSQVSIFYNNLIFMINYSYFVLF